MQFFRYEWHEYAEHDFEGELCSPKYPNPKLSLITFDLVKETKKGYWIGQYFPKWIPKVSKRRYAYPTKEEAMQNFVARTEARIRILKRHLDCCEIILNQTKNQL